MPRQEVVSGNRRHRRDPLNGLSTLGSQLSTYVPMFRRIIYEDWQLIFPVVALAVASLVYLAAAWRATKMKPAQIDCLANLPFEKE